MNAYVAGHVEEALAHSGETDVHVAVANGCLVLTGHVTTTARHDALTRIATDLAEGLPVRNEVEVLQPAEPDAEEAV